MNNEQTKAKELAELLTAFADGKQLQCRNGLGEWEIFTVLNSASIYTHFDRLRFKPETKRVALNQQDLIERRKLGFDAMWVRHKKFLGEHFITDIMIDGVSVKGTSYSYNDLMTYYDFLDGTPCYKEVEDEIK